MHADEHVATAEQVRRLLTAQHPDLAGLPVTPVAEHGSDHLLFRLGADLVARMPRLADAAGQAASDAAWLPRLAPYLPVATPVPVALGEPGEGFPWAWSVAPWLRGRPPVADDRALPGLAEQLAAYVLALHGVDPSDGPPKRPGTRGAALHHVDLAVRDALVAMRALPDVVARLDLDRVTALWDDALAAPVWDGPPTWIHGDLLPGNLLVAETGDLTGVIDYGAAGVGDPSPDLLPFWAVLDPAGRHRFRAALAGDPHVGDPATWRRGRGWAIAPACTGIAYYHRTVPAFAERGLRTLGVVLAESARPAGCADPSRIEDGSARSDRRDPRVDP